MIKVIKAENVPLMPNAPFSHAIAAYGNLLFISGQIGTNPATGSMAGNDVASQAEQVCKNVGSILKAADTDFDKVAKCTCFLSDITDFAVFNSVYSKYFISKPARSCYAVKDLPMGALCEIEAIATLD